MSFCDSPCCGGCYPTSWIGSNTFLKLFKDTISHVVFLLLILSCFCSRKLSATPMKCGTYFHSMRGCHVLGLFTFLCCCSPELCTDFVVFVDVVAVAVGAFAVAALVVDSVFVDFAVDVVGVGVDAVVDVVVVVFAGPFLMYYHLDEEQLHGQKLHQQQHNVEPFSTTSAHCCCQVNCCVPHCLMTNLQSSYSFAAVVVQWIHAHHLGHCYSAWLMDSSVKNS
jgi:hypothetical protein